MQHRPTLQTAPPRETGTPLAADAATAWGSDLDHTERSRLFHPSRGLPLVAATRPAVLDEALISGWEALIPG